MADQEFPPGCTCERIDASTLAEQPDTRFIRGHSDPPCRVHLPRERALYDTGYTRGHQRGYEDGYAAGAKPTLQARKASS